MSILRTKIRYTGAVPKNIKGRARQQMFRDAYQALGVLWHQKLRPKHFTHAGAREYGYAPRKGEAGSGRRFHGSYTAQKLKKYGHTLPLVFTGESRRLTEQQDVRATSKGSRIVIRANKFNFRHPKSNVKMRRDMTELSAREIAMLTLQLRNYLHAQFTAHNQWRWPPTTVTI